MSEQTQASQEASTNSEVTPAQETPTNVETTQSPDTSKPEGATAKTEETWEYNGDRNAVPDPFKKYVSALDRYVSKKDQARVELERKVKEYEAKLASTQRNDTPQASNTGTSTPQAPQVTQEEAEAIMLGDAKTLQSVIQREAKHLLEANVNPKEAVINQKLSAMELRQKEIDAAETISAFTSMNPDFTDLINSPVGQYMVDAARQGMDIETIYKNARQIKDHFIGVAETQRKADLEKKRNGSVVGKSISGDPAVVYADDEDQAKRLAIELTLKGDNRQVQVKTRKR